MSSCTHSWLRQWLCRTIVRATVSSAALIILLLYSGPLSSQEASPLVFREYVLQHAKADDVAARFRSELMENQPGTGVFVDRQRNQVVLRGTPQIHRLAEQMVKTLDRAVPTRNAQVPPGAAANRTEVRGYSIPVDQLDSVAKQLQKVFPAARIVADARTLQVIVVAAPAVQQQVTQFLQSSSTRPLPAASAVGNAPASQASVAPRTTFSRHSTDEKSLNHISWRELESFLRDSFGDRLSVNPDRTGLMATVTAAGPNGSQPVMQIDRRSNRVTFTGNPDATAAWKQVAAALDNPPGNRSQAMRVVPVQRARPSSVQRAVDLIHAAAGRGNGTPTVAAYQVQAEGKQRLGSELVSMLYQPQQREQAREETQPPRGEPKAEPGSAVAVQQQPNTPAQPPRPGPATPPGAQAGGALDPDADTGGLFGPVQIEFVEGLNTFIIRGHERDVARVMQIIEKIEAQAKETQPETEIYMLQHANNQAIGQLILSFYETVYGNRISPVSIVPLGKPNALLLIGVKESIEEIKKLIVKLDKPADPNAQIKVFRLLHAAATDVQAVLQSYYTPTGQPGQPGGQAGGQTTDLSSRVLVVADFRSNSLIVQASPRDMAEIAKLIEELDVDTTPATDEVRVFYLKNTLAAEMQQVLQAAITGQTAGQAGIGGGPQVGVQGQATQQGGTQGQGTTPSKTLAIQQKLEIMGATQPKIIESGILTGIVITANPTANTIVVRAPKNSMALVAELIRQLDQLPDAEAQIKVFPLENGDAIQITQVLQQLFGLPVTAGQGFAGQSVQAASLANLRTGAAGGESSLIPLQFSFDPRTNSVIATGSPADLKVVETLILRLDLGDVQTRVTKVLRLKNAPANDVATAIQNFLQSQRDISNLQFQTGGIGAFADQLDREVIVVPELITNSLIISATPKYFENIIQIITDLDFRPPMVMIQVMIAEVQLDDNFEFGVEFGLQDSLLFDRGIATVGGPSDPGFNFNNTTANLPNLNANGREVLAGQALSSFGVGRLSSTANFGGLVLSAANESISVLLRALQSEGRVQVLSRPVIMTMDTEPAFVQIGQTTSRITGSQNLGNGGGVSNSVVDTEVGLLLTVQPRVNQDGLISMTVDTENSALGEADDGVPVAVDNNGNPVISPNINITTASTTLSARSGQTVVFAGLIQQTKAQLVSKVPYLGDIPLLGNLFRFDREVDKRSELMIIMTPYLVNGDEDLEWLNTIETDRMSWAISDVIESFGDQGFSAGRGLWGEGVDSPVIYPHDDPTGLQSRPGNSRRPIAPPDGLIDPGPAAEGSTEENGMGGAQGRWTDPMPMQPVRVEDATAPYVQPVDPAAPVSVYGPIPPHYYDAAASPNQARITEPVQTPAATGYRAAPPLR
ncbi:MAG: secretin N-terminal domain-containing protein [Planctomycetota bacterium]|nr:secretin N-terminal domain-containing protein [Planctomycetota bacterium]